LRLFTEKEPEFANPRVKPRPYNHAMNQAFRLAVVVTWLFICGPL